MQTNWFTILAETSSSVGFDPDASLFCPDLACYWLLSSRGHGQSGLGYSQVSQVTLATHFCAHQLLLLAIDLIGDNIASLLVDNPMN